MSKKQNQLIGWALLSLLFVGYVQVFNKPPKGKSIQTQTEATSDSQDTAHKEPSFMGEEELAINAEQGKEVTLKNEKIKVTFSTQGGCIKAIELHDYTSYDDYQKGEKQPLKLLTGSRFDLVIPTPQGVIHTKDCLFEEVKSDDSQQITFIYRIPNQKNAYIRQNFSLNKADYQLSCQVETRGIELTPESEGVILRWAQEVRRTERDAEINKKDVVTYYQLTNKNKVKYSGYRNKKKEVTELSEHVGWVASNTKFFNTGIIFEQPAQKATLTSLPVNNKQDPDLLKKVGMAFTLDRDQLLEEGHISFKLYCGPNIQQDLKTINAPRYKENYYLGTIPFWYISQYFLLPIAKKLQDYTSSYLLILLVLLLILTLIQLPLTYHNYLNSIREKALTPMIAQIKKSSPEDPLKVQMEERKLRNRAGIGFSIWNLFGMVFQIPMFIIMLNFINYNIGFRQASFLWIKDLSTYDSILRLPFRVPYFGYSHISLVALLGSIGMLLPTWIKNRKKEKSNEESMMQYLPAILFFLLFNGYSAAFNIYRVISRLLNFIPTLFFGFFVDQEKVFQIVANNLAKNPSPASTISRAHKRMMKKQKK
ncbi:MAG: membrane protein insertase YidC [Bacteroidota bacterium]